LEKAGNAVRWLYHIPGVKRDWPFRNARENRYIGCEKKNEAYTGGGLNIRSEEGKSGTPST